MPFPSFPSVSTTSAQPERPKINNLLITAIAATVLSPVNGWAVQPHGGAEGLVSHELGHLLFMLGIVIMLIKVRGYGRETGWSAFTKFLWLAIVWNILTFSSHWMDTGSAADNFLIFDGQKTGFQIQNFLGLFYYLSKLDHLVLIPALLYLLTALKLWSRDVKEIS